MLKILLLLFSRMIVLRTVFAMVCLINFNTAYGFTFRVDGSVLYDPCREPMVIRGTNAGIAFPLDLRGGALDQIAKTGANAVRLTYRWLINRSDPFSVKIGVKRAIDNQMVAIPSIWDATGNWENFPFTVEFWAQPEMVAVLRQYEDMVLLNIANEAGGGQITNEQYSEGYIWAIKKLRSAGLHMPLVIDAANWGRRENYILENAKRLIESDPDHNLIFSWHPWDSNQPRSRYENAIERALLSDIHLIIGEFANLDVSFSSEIDYPFIMELAAKKNTGWLWWWWSSGKTVDGHALTTDGIFGHWVNRGEEVVLTNPYGLIKTAQRTYFLKNKTCQNKMIKAPPPVEPTKIKARAIQGTEIEITWQDNSNDEKNFDIEIWNNRKNRWDLLKVVEPNETSARVGGAMSFVYNINSRRDLSLNYDETYQFRVAAYLSRDSVSYSETVTVKTQHNISTCSNGDGLKGEYFYEEHQSQDFEKYTKPKLVKIDRSINFNWGNGSPSPDIAKDHFQIRWTGYVEPQFTGEYTFYTNSDDFARVWVDNKLIINNWAANALGWAIGKIQLTAGKKYSIKLEYREWTNNAYISLYWASNQLKRQLVPQCRLFSGS